MSKEVEETVSSLLQLSVFISIRQQSVVVSVCVGDGGGDCFYITTTIVIDIDPPIVGCTSISVEGRGGDSFYVITTISVYKNPSAIG